MNEAIELLWVLNPPVDTAVADIAALEKVKSAMEKTLLTVAAAKTSAEKASATIKAKTASEIRAGLKRR